MTAGYPVALADVNARAGQLATTLRDILTDVDRFNTFLQAQPDAFFTALGMSSPDLTILRASFVDLDKVFLLAHGQATQPAASDFFFNAKNLSGVL
jgi:hypothetical protein